MLSLVELELAVKPCVRPAALHLPEDAACHGQAQSSTYKRASDEESWVAEQERHRDAQNHSGPPTNTDRSPHLISSEAAHDDWLPIQVVGEEVERSILQVSGLSHGAVPVKGRQ
ncbi:hypothetical protein EMIT047CA2_80090 [Pseudomonas soli]